MLGDDNLKLAFYGDDIRMFPIHQSTVSRELRRCREDALGYRPELAEEHAVSRWRRNPGLRA
jgi:IS30 family transposase